MLNPVVNGLPSLAPAEKAPSVRVQVPMDVHELIQQEPSLATHWRDVTRRAFVERLEAGYRVSGFVRPPNGSTALPYYVLTRPTR